MSDDRIPIRKYSEVFALPIINNFYLEPQWKVEKIFNKILSFDKSLNYQDVGVLCAGLVKNCPVNLVDIYCGYLKTKKLLSFNEYCILIYRLSRAGIRGKKAGIKLRNYLTVKRLLEEEIDE